MAIRLGVSGMNGADSWQDQEGAFSEELADGALEWAESLYATIPPYRDGWWQIHPDDREDWLGSLGAIPGALEALARWNERGLLSRAQSERLSALLGLRERYDPVVADLARGAAGAMTPVRDPAFDDLDLF